ncbi:hypothetical protein PV379_03975 [Streptomyces caniscabiei]|nr:hypothetical protein [Streptomyces caniscabiei]MDX2776497.1 hypothetical protein [Streptomyces caniscabiei]
MEQDTDRILLSDTLKRMGYRVRLGFHLVFIAASFLLAGFTLASLLFVL